MNKTHLSILLLMLAGLFYAFTPQKEQEKPPELLGFGTQLPVSMKQEIDSFFISSMCCNFSIVVDESGQAISYDFSHPCDPMFRRVFDRQLATLEFNPAMKNGVPVRATYTHDGCISLKYFSRFYQAPIPEAPTYLRDQLKLEVYNKKRDECIQGELWIRVKVNRKGAVDETHIAYSNNEYIEKICTEEAMKLRFSPAIDENITMDSWYTFHLEFKSDACE